MFSKLSSVAAIRLLVLLGTPTMVLATTLLGDTSFSNGFIYSARGGCSATLSTNGYPDADYCAQQVVTTTGASPSWSIAILGSLGSLTNNAGVPNPPSFQCQSNPPYACQLTSYVKDYVTDPSGNTLLRTSQDAQSGIPLDANGNIPVVIEGSDAQNGGSYICNATTAIPNNFQTGWWFPYGRCDRAKPRLANFPSQPGSPNYGPLVLRQVSTGNGAVTLTTNSFNEYFFRHANPLPSTLMTGYHGVYTEDIADALNHTTNTTGQGIELYPPTTPAPVFSANSLPSYLYIDDGVDDKAVNPWSDLTGGEQGWQHMYMVQAMGMAPIGALTNITFNVAINSNQYNYVPCDSNSVGTELATDSQTYGGGCKVNWTMDSGASLAVQPYVFQNQTFNYPPTGFILDAPTFVTNSSAPAWSCGYGYYMDSAQYAAYTNNQTIPNPNGTFDIGSVVLYGNGTYPAITGVTATGNSVFFPSKGSAYSTGLTFAFAPGSGGTAPVQELSQVVTNMSNVVSSQSTGSFTAPLRAQTAFNVDGSHVVSLAHFWECSNPDGSNVSFYVPSYKLIQGLDANNGGPIPHINDPYASCATTGLNYNSDGSVNNQDCTQDQPSSGGYNGPPVGLSNGKYAYYDVENSMYANWQASNIYTMLPYNGTGFPSANIFSPYTLNPNPALGSRSDSTLNPVSTSSYSYGVLQYKSYVGTNTSISGGGNPPYPNTGVHISDPNYYAPWEDRGGRTWNTGGNLGKITYQNISSPVIFHADLMPYLTAAAMANYDAHVYSWLSNQACTQFAASLTTTQLNSYGLLTRYSHPIPTNIGIPSGCIPPVGIPANVGDGYVMNAFVLQSLEATDLSVNSMTYSNLTLDGVISNQPYAQSLLVDSSNGPYSIPVSWYFKYGLNPFLDSNSPTSLAATNGQTYYYDYANGLAPVSLGIAKNDFDGDGKADVLLRNTTTGDWNLTQLNGLTVLNQGSVSGALTDTKYAIAPIVSTTFDLNGDGKTPDFTTADFNGDGKADVLSRSTVAGTYPANTFHVDLMNGTTVIGSAYLTTMSTNANDVVMSTKDFNRDGRADVLLRNSVTGVWTINYMNGTNAPTIATLNASTDTCYTMKGDGDYDGNGYPDLLLRKDKGGACGTSSYPWLIDFTNGTSSILTSSTAPGVVLSPTYSAVVTDKDFNGDGKSDILVRYTGSSPQLWVLYDMNGTATVSGIVTSGIAVQSVWQFEAAGDFNSDGMEDIMLRSTSTGQLYIYLMNNATAQSSGAPSTNFITSTWIFQGIDDYNGDGKSDILLRNSSTGQWWLYLMNGYTVQSNNSVSITTNLSYVLQNH